MLMKAVPAVEMPSGWSGLLKTGFLNVVLRGITLLSKFVLVIFLARYLSPAEVGVYGLFVATIGFAIYLLGLDFYIFNTREILAQEPHERTCLIRDQIAFHGIVYLVVLPLLLLVFFGGLLAWQYLAWFYVLLIMEHLSQEAFRLLAVLSKPLQATLVLFLRSGAWVYAVVALMYTQPQSRDLVSVWIGWVLGVGLSLGLASYYLRDLDWRAARKIPVNWGWIKKGVLVALPFLASSLALRGIFTMDRYFLKHYWGNEAVGVYVFYANIANVVLTLVETGVIMVMYPKIIGAYQKGRMAEYHQFMRKLTYGVGVAVLGLSAVAVILIYPVLAFVDQPLYAEYIKVFWILLTATVVMSLETIPHYALYARQMDKAIILSTAFGLVIAVLCNLLLIPNYGIVGAALAVLCAMTGICLTKIGMLWRYR